MNTNRVSKIVSGLLLCTMCAYTIPVFGYTKDETVYSKLDNKGDKYRTIVSTHIENNEEVDLLNDLSDLINIENTNGGEEFTKNEQSLIWKTNKNDIYYKGESQKELPLECNVKYELDGKEIEANELAGKSGNVKIIIEYINKDEHIVEINGKNEKMYTPFVAVTGAIFKNDKNKDIKISSGKVINDGSKSILVGLTLPGLQESLNIDKKTLEISNKLEISMNATDFESNDIITFVTPKVLEETDLEVFDKIDQLYEKINVLQESSNQIEQGANTIAKGTGALTSGSTVLKQGTNTAYNGAKQIKTEVEKSTNALKTDNSEALDDTTLNTIGNQAQGLANLTQNQKTDIGNEAKTEAMKVIQSQKIAIGKQASEKAKKQIEAKKEEIGKQAENQVAGLKLTDSQKQQINSNVKNNLEKNINFNSLSEEQKAIVLQFSQVSAISTAQTIAQETAKKVANQTAETIAIQIAEQIADSTAQTVAEEVAGTIANQTAQTVAQNTATQVAKTTATSTAKQVANQVKETAQNQVVSQMNTLENGLTQLTNGLSDLDNGASTLQEGIKNLNEGANILVKGIQTFNEDGINKICNYINSDVKDITTRVKKLTDLAKEYTNFTMLNENNDGNVKFIMIIDAIKKQEEKDNSKEDLILDTKNDNNKYDK